MAAALLTLDELAIWVRSEIPSESEDFATYVIQGASLVVMEAAGHPEWTRSTAPERARLIAQLLAKRTYLNPDAVVRENIGPLGESRVEDFARTMELTPAERAELEKIGGALPAGQGEIFALNLGGPVTVEADVSYLMDEAGTPILYHEPGDVGAPEE